MLLLPKKKLKIQLFVTKNKLFANKKSTISGALFIELAF